jgi:hypothetical protein
MAAPAIAENRSDRTRVRGVLRFKGGEFEARTADDVTREVIFDLRVSIGSPPVCTYSDRQDSNSR